MNWESPVIRKSLPLSPCPAHVAPDTQRGEDPTHMICGGYICRRLPIFLPSMVQKKPVSVIQKTSPVPIPTKPCSPGVPVLYKAEKTGRMGGGRTAGKALTMQEDLPGFRSQHHVKARNSDSTYNPSAEEAKMKGSLNPARW